MTTTLLLLRLLESRLINLKCKLLLAIHTSPPVDHPQSRLLSQGHKEVIHKFRRDLSEIGVELPSMESMSEAFEQMKMIKDVMEVSTHQINLLTSPTFLPKVKDQGKFTLPCTLGHIELDNALVDSGASINLISSHNGRKAWHCWSIAAPYYFNHVWRCNF
ncbi:unnamed protein product [Microthlaspi erraticum]|uniref:Aspartic peptidase DDI1-type domain-containing protein n=1 Tax=Microthlaspi erraticum TaxID=1685480 RepID=A0A6D2HU56_9BRAS|nr:unnamed protein product [Microthlaspi erraticum]